MKHFQGSTCSFKDYQGVENGNDLFKVIDFAKVRCLHEKHSKTGAHLFREWGRRLDKTYFITSQSDGDLLLIVPFAVQVKIQSIYIIGKYENTVPPKLRLFINTQNVDFSPTEEQEVQQLSSLQGLQHNQVDPNKFGEVHKLIIHFPNKNMQEMAVSYIQINGELSNIKEQSEGSSMPQKYRDHFECIIQPEIQLAEEQFANKQAKILTKEKFLTVFTKEEIKYKLNINWQVFQHVSFEDSAKRMAMNQINIIMMYAGKNTKQYKALYDLILKLNQAQRRVDQQCVDNIAYNYFKKKFPKCRISVNIKYDGVQLGNKVRIYPQNQKPIIITYHVKTHLDGLAYEKNQAAKMVNPIELMIYKILENLGIGCESHFFGRELKNFYIATKDAGHNGPYFSYEQLLQGNENYLQFLSSEDFYNGIFCINLLSRILRLTDVQTNYGNFGFVEQFDGWYLKIVDFRPPRQGDYEINQTQFEEFLQGKTQVQYQDKVITTLFEKYKDKLKRIASRIFTLQFKGFNDITEESEKNVLNVISNFQKDISEEGYKGMLEKLSLYKEAVKSNFGIFSDKLQMNSLAKGIDRKKLIRDL